MLQKLSAEQFVPVKVQPGRDRYALQRRWSRSGTDRSTKKRTYWVRRERRRVHSVGEVLLLFSTTKLPRQGEPLHEPKILMSDCLSWTAREMVLLYTLRWQIELFFKEMKSVLGMHQYRLRRFDRVERWLDVVLATFVYLEWYRWRQCRRQDLDEKRRAWWEAQRTKGLCQVVRQRAEEREILGLGQRLHTLGGRKKLRQLLRAALPKELRKVI